LVCRRDKLAQSHSASALAARKTIEFDSHFGQQLFYLAMLYFGRRQKAWLLGVRGYEFDFSEAFRNAQSQS